jgi:predicted amidohydrolase YtcJ
MKQLVTGGRIFTGNRAQPWAEAMVTNGSQVVFVGPASEVGAHINDATVRLDLGGRLVMPGFVDAHAHVVMTGESLLKAQLRSAQSLEEILDSLREWSDANPDAPRILGTGWLFQSVPDGKPTKEMLDTVFPDKPVYLDANDYHSGWVNSKAIEALGITLETPDPIGGEIVRNPVTKEPTGLLLETAYVEYLMLGLPADATPADTDRKLETALRAYRESGVTTTVDMAMGQPALDAVLRAEAEGTMTIRVIGHWIIHNSGNSAENLAQVQRAREVANDHHTDYLRMIGIKLIVDGTIDGCTAAMLSPYTNETNAAPIWDVDSLNEVVAAADAMGLQIALHAIGDYAVRMAIDALERAAKLNGTKDRRHRIEHLEYVDEADVGRLAPLGITASMQPVHVNPSIMENWVAMLGPERSHRGFAWPEYLDAGTTLAFGSDTPTASHLPLHNMYIAATRKSPTDHHLEPHRPDFSLPLDESITHATNDAAWASFAEDRLGSLEVGKYADYVVVGVDVFAGDPTALLTASVDLTVVGGKVVFGG